MNSIIDCSKPLVSVIIPAYNHESYIKSCIESVLNQNYSNIELIIFNDGSTDKTDDVIRSVLVNKGGNIKYISKENEGLCKTLNKGLEIAHGTYIAFIASDDLWLPDRINKQVDFLENNKNLGMVFSDAYFIYGQDKSKDKYTGYKPIIRKCYLNSVPNTNIYEMLLRENIIPAVSALIRRDCYEKVGQYDISLKFEDYDMWLRISKEYPIGFIDEPLVYYRLHDSNISKNMKVMFIGSIQALKKQYNSEYFTGKPFKKFIFFLEFLSRAFMNKVNKYLFH